MPCSASRVVPGAHRVVGPGTHRGSGPREVHTTSRPLLTVSTVDRSVVLHFVEVVQFDHKLRKSSEELWIQPCDAGQAPYHTCGMWLHRDATWPLQRFLIRSCPLEFSGLYPSLMVSTLAKTAIPRGLGYSPTTLFPLFALSVRPLQTRVSN
jgi:hypothetical protein